MKRIAALIVFMCCSISILGQKLGHAYHFDFDSKSISQTGNFNDWRKCPGSSMTLFDESSVITISDSDFGNIGFIITKVNEDKQNHAWFFTCMGKDNIPACTVIWQKKYVTILVDDTVVKYHISSSHEEEH